MPVFRLTERLLFPPPELAIPGGLLAVGGDLAPERLLLAYRHGIFPWFSPGEPILWWSPDPRCVLFPDRLRISRSMRRLIRSRIFTITFDTCFADVMTACQEERRGREGTWITAGMKAAYVRLHEMGLAHSVEVWREDCLAGGLYGVSLGRIFFGESMFSRVANASKAALIALVQQLAARDFQLIDCQIQSEHLQKLGAEMIPRDGFLRMLRRSLARESLCGSWSFFTAGDGATLPLPGRTGDHGTGRQHPPHHFSAEGQFSPGMSFNLTASRRRAASPYFVAGPSSGRSGRDH